MRFVVVNWIEISNFPNISLRKFTQQADNNENREIEVIKNSDGKGQRDRGDE